MPDHMTLLDTKRLAQLTGDRDPQDWPMMNLTGGWNVVGVDEGPTAEHEGRLYVYFGDVATSDDGGHHPIGWNFVLPNKTQGANDTTGQPDWRFCVRCNGLFRAPKDSASGSVCPFGGEHVPAGWNFVLPNNMQGATDTTGQPDWRFCGQCHGLFHAQQEEPGGGVCPAGDRHRPDGWIFYLPSREQGAPDSSGQPDWHLCATCHGLFWQPGDIPNLGICPAVDPRNSDLVAWTDDTRVAEAVLVEHDPQGWNFALPNTTQGATDTTGQPDWRYCAKCNGLFFAPHEAATGSRCPLGGEHVPAGWNFVLPNNVQGATDTTGQPDWRYCGNCHGLFWAPHGATDGTVCPVGGEHSYPPDSWIFHLPSREQGADASSGQPEWHFCSRCHGLLWTGAATPGTCPRSTAGGFRLNPVMRDPSNFDPMRATAPVGITKSLERPGGPFSHDGRAYAFVNISAPQYSEQLRPGNPTLGTHLVSKADPSNPGPHDTEFLFSPRIGACPTGPGGALQSHQVLGLSFILPHDHSASPISQAGWRHCRTCEALFFPGEAATTGGVCWATRQPHDGVGSAVYAVPLDESGLRTQGAWKRCGNCAAAVFTGYSATPDLCPAGDAGRTWELGGLNQYALPVGSIGVFTSDWGEVSRERAVCGIDESRKAPCSTDTWELTVRHSRVVSASTTPGRGPIPADSLVLLGREAGARVLAGLPVGTAVVTDYRLASNGPVPFAFALGAYPMLRDGRPLAGLDAHDIEPRTAVCLADHGRLLTLLSTDGRESTSTGMALTELAQALRGFGCSDGVYLDGGASATLVTRNPDTGDLAVRNHLDHDQERRIPNAIGIFAE
ncbi:MULTISPECIES: phosphodiester glycosidase family protein [unclassified Kitasatospora]|uniref:phosphodiester glycosidase family protein n=1 Tax=unclassified Kitasatospora TaxID=2633591 RepID=UPI0033D6BADB